MSPRTFLSRWVPIRGEMSSRCKPDPEFATELYSQLLDSEPLAGLNPARRDFLAESILPVLFEALPELLQAVQRICRAHRERLRGHQAGDGDCELYVKLGFRLDAANCSPTT